jgi:hypothetical protein
MRDAANSAQVTRLLRRPVSSVPHCRSWHADLACDRAVIQPGLDQPLCGFKPVCSPHYPKLWGAADRFLDALGGRIGRPRA